MHAFTDFIYPTLDLRWMNSGVPWSRLNGFFVRLRLGKPEAGLEGNSYYVACLTGT